MVSHTRIVERQSDLQKTGRDFDSEPDTKATVDFDDIAGTDTSQQVQAPPPQQGGDMGAMPPPGGAEGMPEQPVPQDIPDGAETDPKKLEKDSDIMTSLSGHPYIDLFDGRPESELNPMKIVDLDKQGLLDLKAHVDQISLGHELRKKIGLYKDKQYQLIASLKSFISDVLSYK